MKDYIETTSELLAAVNDERKKLTEAKQPTAFLDVAHGGLRTAIDNFGHEQDRRDKKPS